MLHATRCCKPYHFESYVYKFRAKARLTSDQQINFQKINKPSFVLFLDDCNKQFLQVTESLNRFHIKSLSALVGRVPCHDLLTPPTANKLTSVVHCW